MFRKAVAGLCGALISAAFVAPVLAAPAGAATVFGSVEICKASVTGNLAVTGPFVFTVSSGVGEVTVDAGQCSPVINVGEAGPVTIQEALAPSYLVTAITALPGSTYLTPPTPASLAAQTATVTITPGSVSAVTFTNQIDPGHLEICKAAATGSGLTGNFSFNVQGADGWLNGAPAAANAPAISVPVGACSPPVEMPAGSVVVTEAGTNLYVTSITATWKGGTASALLGTNTTTGQAAVAIAAVPNPTTNPNDTSGLTNVFYTNDVVAFKVCKVWDATQPPGIEPGGPSTLFPFTITAAGPAGPNTVTSPVSVQAGQCSLPQSLRAGTEVTITEGVVPGTKVESIAATGAESVVTGSLSLANRTVSIFVGTPVTASGPPGNEAQVTFTDQDAAPGQLKICKFAGTTPGPPVVPPSGTFSFTVSGVANPVLVPLGSCVVVPGEIPFNSTVTVTEAASSGNAVSALSVNPTNISVFVGGVQTQTNEATLVSGPTTFPTAIDTAVPVQVLIGEQQTTEVDFTNVDPPAATPAPAPVVPVGGGDVTVANPGDNAGTTTAPNLSIANSVASTIASTSISAPTLVLAKPLTLSSARSMLNKDERTLASVQRQLTSLEHAAKTARGAARRLDLKKITQLQAQVRTLNGQIRVLNSDIKALSKH